MQKYGQTIFNPPSWSQENNTLNNLIEDTNRKIKRLTNVMIQLKTAGLFEGVKRTQNSINELEKQLESLTLQRDNSLDIPMQVFHS
ncbi:hypothetical protein [Commensalibacter oyaizuii]|uniref:Transposase n=1 Tax=Commensalibacter oyaizuii TaxID=3043873 RepID=A0ABT6Q3A2_9PROT|nr:hypothetical protein [Commensalibacter sp. TBRC 16381]MDI2091591.1 hypothetical protein [Commensalibacter sp. TBRC 16381]